MALCSGDNAKVLQYLHRLSRACDFFYAANPIIEILLQCAYIDGFLERSFPKKLLENRNFRLSDFAVSTRDRERCCKESATHRFGCHGLCLKVTWFHKAHQLLHTHFELRNTSSGGINQLRPMEKL